MKNIRFPAFVLTLILIGNSVIGQTPATDSQQFISGDHLKPYSNKWKMYSVDAQGTERLVTVWTDYAQLIKLEGKTYMSRIQELYNPNLSLRELWTNLFERTTLLPYRASQFKTSGDYSYSEFNSDKIVLATKTANKEAVKVDYSITSPTYDWSLYGILLSGLPFEKGKYYNIPVLNQQNASGKGNIIATIEGAETVKDDNGNDHEAWKVSTNVGLTFWLTKEAPYVIQLTSPAQNGGYTIWRIF